MTERSTPAPDVVAPSVDTAVVVTAGHVDHGKSSLIRAMTGMDPDRLEEEKRRGLTIELGYAWCTLPSGREVGFVDVPGHERFVRTMLAGVGPVRLVLFVVAADEGWKPQSEEHLEIVDVLGVDGAVVALTKRDLAEAGRLTRTQDEVRERLAGTALEGSPLIPVSAVSGEGLDDMVGALDAMLAGAPEPERDGRPRQHVDRVFSIKGAGTVVTGTLTGGTLAVGDDVELLPSRARSRVRGLQTHHRDVDLARPISRVATNLPGIERGSLERGQVLVRPGEWRPTEMLEARIRPIRSLARPLTARGAFKLHAGAAERDARVRLYDVETVPPEGAFARIALSGPLVLEVGDRFVLRESGRRETVAGGVVLDPAPPRRAGTSARARLAARERVSREDLPAQLVSERRAVRAGDLEIDLGVAPVVVPGARRLGAWWVATDLFDEMQALADAELASFHAREPAAVGQDVAAIRPSITRALASAHAPHGVDLAEALIEGQVADGVLVRDGSLVRLAAHRPATMDEDERRLVAAVREGEPTPPTIAELRTAGFERGRIDAATRSGRLVRISPDLVLSFEFVERAAEVVREAGDNGITVSALRERLGTSRKYAVPLMEHFDRIGETRRSGDLRFPRTIRPRSGT